MNKKIVCYFSASGVTKEVANKISKLLESDIFEIEPKDKYTDEDLDWTNKNSRSSIEMNDKNSRPAIINKLENLDAYDTVVLGFPVWWYTAPTIINTFIEENDLSNKNIYVFVTSGSSSQAGSFKNLKEKYTNLNFVDAKRLTSNSSDDDLIGWIK